jgi:hypothetical protein
VTARASLDAINVGLDFFRYLIRRHRASAEKRGHTLPDGQFPGQVGVVRDIRPTVFYIPDKTQEGPWPRPARRAHPVRRLWPRCRWFLRLSCESCFSARASRMTIHRSRSQERQVKSETDSERDYIDGDLAIRWVGPFLNEATKQLKCVKRH